MNWIVLQYRQSEVLVSFILGAEWNCLAITQQALRFQVKTRIGQEPSAESVKVEDRRKSLQQQKEELCKVRCFLHLLTRCFFCPFLPLFASVASSGIQLPLSVGCDQGCHPLLVLEIHDIFSRCRKAKAKLSFNTSLCDGWST